ncbi:MAG: hypothetical protein AAF481_07275 [Acidobacteriota bacterium]
MIAVAGALVWLVSIYALVGLIFAIAFVLRGVSRIDPAADGGSWGFRLVILPGVVAFWPYLAWRWVRGTPPPQESSAHLCDEPATSGWRQANS